MPSLHSHSRPSRNRLVTTKTRSPCHMRAVTRSLAQAIPTARVGEIDGAAHAVAFDAPGNFAQVIVEAMPSSEVRPTT